MHNMERMAYKGWPNCVRLSNETIELIITADVGPRIIFFGFTGGENELCVFPETAGKTGGDDWRVYGGHRLWYAPEDVKRSYLPDNTPVAVEEMGGVVRFTQPLEQATGIQKELEIRFTEGGNGAAVLHRLCNRGVWPIELAPWSLTVMRPGGTAILPLPPRGLHQDNLLPTGVLSLWAYTDLSDPRYHFGQRYILVNQDEDQPEPQKIGLTVSDGWAGYARNGHVFIKRFGYDSGAVYPDRGVNVEVFINERFLELESLGAVQRLEVGETVEHLERWNLFGNVAGMQDDADVAALVAPLVQRL